MNQPNFQAMTKKELRAYVLAHRDDDEAFYAYVDKIRAVSALVQSAVIDWLKFHNPGYEITKIEKPSKFTLTNLDEKRLVYIQLMMSSLPTHKPFIETLIGDRLKDEREEIIDGILTIFVASDRANAILLEKEIAETNFENRTKSAWVVGCVNAEGKFQSVAEIMLPLDVVDDEPT